MDLRFIGACAPLFLLALLFDVVGFVLLFVGIFANLQVNGRFYGDFLIHTGGVLVFCSLGWWLMWYAGNIQVSREGASRGRGGTAHRCKQLARKLTERLSRTQRKEDDQQSVMKTTAGGGAGGADMGDKEAARPQAGSKVTWGKSSCYHNQGYEEEPENHMPEEQQEEEEKNLEMLL
ncbi:transmembrane protein 238-like [Astyanax mexicanus]|uniref:Transmembrane protein 238-like n=1 Tax=Astyanax mexicanus TaxID=7994 RepID=A0A8T2M7V0_ASTMX|nr:transmembrane protein 238-like [Astyanax mexicanus]